MNFTRGSETYYRYPPETWQPGQIWRTDLDINLNPLTPPGQQKIVLQVFDPGGTAAWHITDGTNAGNDWLFLQTIQITR
jgi:hypothetical protein